MEQRDWVTLAMTILPMVLIVSVIGIMALSGLPEWLGDRAADRKMGRGQGALWRQAIRDRAIPAGADVAAWRVALTEMKAPPPLWSSMTMPALLLLLGLWFVISSRDLAEVVSNMVFVLMSVALGTFVWAIRRRQIRERQLLIRLVEGHGDP